MESLLIYVLIGVMFLLASIVVLEIIAVAMHRETKECNGHDWEYGEDGELVCKACRKKAKDVIGK